MNRGDFGAIAVADGQVRFRIWAPDARCVSVALAGKEPQPMTRDEQGVFEANLDCEFGATYKYLIDGNRTVPDPASRSQVLDVHDDSVVVNPAYPWVHTEWHGRPWHETIVYELHVGALGG
jgi:maltooligosyltrehalose trehalohydrolase